VLFLTPLRLPNRIAQALSQDSCFALDSLRGPRSSSEWDCLVLSTSELDLHSTLDPLFTCPFGPRDIASERTQRKTLLPTDLLSCHCYYGRAFIVPLPSNVPRLSSNTKFYKFRDWVRYAHLKACKNIFHLVRVRWLFRHVPCASSVTSLLSFMSSRV
jgi:hypothetical protein